MRIVVTGARGQLGSALVEALRDRLPIALGHAELDVGDADGVRQRIADLRPDVVVNAAAFTRVDDAEARAGDAFRTNALGPWALARATDACGALLVHVSTDYVFDGQAATPYGEDDSPSPRGVYAASKLAGEALVAGANPLHMLVRSAGLYGRGEGGKGGNFVETMLRLAAAGKAIRVVGDQQTAPTAAVDLAAKIVDLVDRWGADRSRELLGLYHVTNSGSCTWLEFAREIFRIAGVNASVEPITTAAYGARAPRPAYSVLARHHLAHLGLDDLRPWQAALVDYLAGRVQEARPDGKRSR